MIRLLARHQIDDKKYDQCIRLDASGLPYGFSWYLDAICDWEALVQDDYNAVMPLPKKKKWGFSYYYKPYAVQQLGVFSKKELDIPGLTQFVQAACGHVYFADICLNENQLTEPLSKTRFASFVNHTLSLDQTYHAMYDGFRNRAKRGIKKTEKEDLQLFEYDSPKVVVDLFKENKGDSLNLPNEFYQKMERAMYTCLHRKMGKVYTVYGAGNQVVAGAFVITGEKRHVLLFTALSEAGKKQGAMFYLLNEYFIFQSEKPIIFDFEGSMSQGVANFYKGFGAKPTEYPRLKYNNLPFLLQWLKQ